MFHILLFFHIVGDFIVQSDKDVAAKSDHPFLGNIQHIKKTFIVYIILAVIYLAIIDQLAVGSLIDILIIVTILSALHIVIDFIKTYAFKWIDSKLNLKKETHTRVDIYGFVIDQLLHLSSIWGILQIIDISEVLVDRVDIIILINAVLISTYLGHEFIKLFLIHTCSEYHSDSQNFSTAKTIGILERMLITPAIIFGFFEVVLAIVAIKVFSGYREQNSAIVSRNSFIIGNLSSFLMIAVGYLYFVLFT